MPNYRANARVQLRVFVASPAIHATFEVEIDHKVVYRGNASSDSPAFFTLPSYFQLLNSNERNKGIRVYATGDEPLFVLCANSLDAGIDDYSTFLAYPIHLNFQLESYEYRVVSVNDDHFTLSMFLLVGTEDNTEVTLVPNQNVLLPRDAQNETIGLVGILRGTSHRILLHRLQTFFVWHTDDLTGSTIVSNKPLTVISGHECAFVPIGTYDCEHIAVQIPPTATWGTEFIITPFAGRTSSENRFRVVSSEENVTLAITCDNSTRFITRINEFPARQTFCYIESTKPVFLTQLAVGGSTDFRGDPTIHIVSPTDQYVNEIEFMSLPTSKFSQSYISVTVLAEHFDGEQILLNNKPVNCKWESIFDRSKSVVGYGCNTTIESDTTPKQHVLKHSNAEGRVSVVVYGFNLYPQRGYAYLAGQTLGINGEYHKVYFIQYTYYYVQLSTHSCYLHSCIIRTYPVTIL